MKTPAGTQDKNGHNLLNYSHLHLVLHMVITYLHNSHLLQYFHPPLCHCYIFNLHLQKTLPLIFLYLLLPNIPPIIFHTQLLLIPLPHPIVLTVFILLIHDSLYIRILTQYHHQYTPHSLTLSALPFISHPSQTIAMITNILLYAYHHHVLLRLQPQIIWKLQRRKLSKTQAKDSLTTI